jgi:hypothetical protein
MIVPGGGLSLDGARWVASRSNFLVHVNVLAVNFQEVVHSVRIGNADVAKPQ